MPTFFPIRYCVSRTDDRPCVPFDSEHLPPTIVVYVRIRQSKGRSFFFLAGNLFLIYPRYVFRNYASSGFRLWLPLRSFRPSRRKAYKVIDFA